MTATTAPKPFKKGYKYRLYPTAEQRQYLLGLFGANRFLWNHLLAQTEESYQIYAAAKAAEPDRDHPRPSTDGYHYVTQIPHLKTQFPWMSDYSAVAYQQTALHLGSAYKRFFERKLTKGGKPRFKSKRNHQSVSLMKTAFTLKDKTFKVGNRLGELKVLWSRDLPSQPSSCTLSMTPSGEFYVSFICEYIPAKTAGVAITGIDFGLKDLVTLSSGEKVANPRHYVQAQRKLRRLQQRLARCKKGSKNREKARTLLARHHQHIASQRHDHLHQLSRRLVNENQVVGIETLNIAGMAKNRRLSKHIMGTGWYEFTRQLAYKSAESGHCRLVMIHPYFPSSHLCASTGEHLGRKLALAERSWHCPHCGETHDRDVNAARVIAQEAVQQLTSIGWPHRPHDGKVLAGSKYVPQL